MKHILLFLLVITAIHSFAQTAQQPEKLKAGLYIKYEDFAKNSPLSEPFVIIPIYITRSFKDTNNFERVDTVEISYEYKLADSTKKSKRVYGFCDGLSRYFLDPNKQQLFGKPRYSKVKGFGKFPFLLDYQKDNIAFLTANPVALVAGVIASTNVLSLAHKELWFFNRYGYLSKATAQSIGWLLKDDPDLRKEYLKETKVDNALFVKYLIKLNDRYHYAGYSLETHQ